jgi:hypothetical protein
MMRFLAAIKLGPGRYSGEGIILKRAADGN